MGKLQELKEKYFKFKVDQALTKDTQVGEVNLNTALIILLFAFSVAAIFDATNRDREYMSTVVHNIETTREMAEIECIRNIHRDLKPNGSCDVLDKIDVRASGIEK